MAIYSYEEAFGASDITSRAMRKAIETWFRLYYGPMSAGGLFCGQQAGTHGVR